MGGKVWLVGAGPGDPELLTLRAHRLLRAADAVVYDRLVSPAIRRLIPARARRIFAGKAPGHHVLKQEEICELLRELADRHQTVVRLKGGDPVLFGRGGEEVTFLRRHGIPCEVVPGITAGAAASLAGIPLTHRNHTQHVTFLTGHARADGEERIDWEALARLGGTLVIYMGLGTLPQVSARLLAAGLPGSTPAALLERVSQPGQRSHITRLDNLATAARRLRFRSPTLIVIGSVVALAEAQDERPAEELLLEEARAWHLPA